MDNLDLLLPQSPGPVPSRRKGVVTSVSPVHVQLDGDTAPMSTSPDKICTVALGDRVYIEIIGEQMIILGVFETSDALVGDVPVGSTFEFAGTTAPPGYLLYQGGEAISRTMYSRLFAVIGTTWGNGDGSTTFNLPDRRGRVAVGKHSSGTFATLGKVGGEEAHKLTIPEMPYHSHAYQTWAGGVGDGDASRVQRGWEGGTLQKFGDTVGNPGGDGAHNNLQPYIVTQYIIRI